MFGSQYSPLPVVVKPKGFTPSPVETLLTPGLTEHGVAFIPKQIDDEDALKAFVKKNFDGTAAISVKEMTRIAAVHGLDPSFKAFVCAPARVAHPFNQLLLKLYRYFEENIVLVDGNNNRIDPYQDLLWQLLMGSQGQYGDTILKDNQRTHDTLVALKKIAFLHSIDPHDPDMLATLALLNDEMYFEGTKDLRCAGGVDNALENIVAALSSKQTLEHWLYALRMKIITVLAGITAGRADKIGFLKINTWGTHFTKLYKQFFRNVIHTNKSDDYYSKYFEGGLDKSGFSKAMLQDEANAAFKHQYQYKAILQETLERYTQWYRDQQLVEKLEDYSAVATVAPEDSGPALQVIEKLLKPFIDHNIISLFGDVFDSEKASETVIALVPDFQTKFFQALPFYCAQLLSRAGYSSIEEHPLTTLMTALPALTLPMESLSADEQVEVYCYLLETKQLDDSDSQAISIWLQGLGYGREPALSRAREFCQRPLLLEEVQKLPVTVASERLAQLALDTQVDFLRYYAQHQHLAALATLQPVWLATPQRFNTLLTYFGSTPLTAAEMQESITTINAYEGDQPDAFLKHLRDRQAIDRLLVTSKSRVSIVIKYLLTKGGYNDWPFLTRLLQQKNNWEMFSELNPILGTLPYMRLLVQLPVDDWSKTRIAFINRLVIANDEAQTVKDLESLVGISAPDLAYVIRAAPKGALCLDTALITAINRYKHVLDIGKLSLLWREGLLATLSQEQCVFLQSRHPDEVRLLMQAPCLQALTQNFHKLKAIPATTPLTKNIVLMLTDVQTFFKDVELTGSGSRDRLEHISQAVHLSVFDRGRAYHHWATTGIAELQLRSRTCKIKFDKKKIDSELAAWTKFRDILNEMPINGRDAANNTACYDKVVAIQTSRDAINALPVALATKKASLLRLLDDPTVDSEHFCKADLNVLASLADHQLASTSLFNRCLRLTPALLVASITELSQCATEQVTARLLAKKMLANTAIACETSPFSVYIDSEQFDAAIFGRCEPILNVLAQLTHSQWFNSKNLSLLASLNCTWSSERIGLLNTLAECPGFATWNERELRSTLVCAINNKMESANQTQLGQLALAFSCQVSSEHIKFLLKNPDQFAQFDARHFAFIAKLSLEELTLLHDSPLKPWEPLHFAQLEKIDGVEITKNFLHHLLGNVQNDLLEQYKVRSCFTFLTVRKPESEQDMKAIAAGFDAIAKAPILSVVERLQLQKWYVETTLQKLSKEVYYGKNRRAQVLSRYYEQQVETIPLKNQGQLKPLNDIEVPALLKKVNVSQAIHVAMQDVAISSSQRARLAAWLADPDKHPFIWDSLLALDPAELTEGVRTVVANSESLADIWTDAGMPRVSGIPQVSEMPPLVRLDQGHASFGHGVTIDPGTGTVDVMVPPVISPVVSGQGATR